jgi:hypothetical protein
MNTTILTKIKNLYNLIAPAFTGILLGLAIGAIIISIALMSLISNRQNQCDAVGDKVQLRSEYRKVTGCNLMMNGKWTPTSELVFTVAKAKAD